MKLSWKKRFQLWIDSPAVSLNDKQLLQTWTSAKQQTAFSQSLMMNNSGWRRPIGLGSDQFNLYTIKQIALAWFRQIKQTNPTAKVLVFADQRVGSQSAKQVCLAVARYLNLTPYTTTNHSRFAPTPFLTYLLKHYDFAGGIMITGSHCPKTFNGCKLFDQNGLGVTATTIVQLTTYINQNYQSLLDTTLKLTNAKPVELAPTYQIAYYQAIRQFMTDWAVPLKQIPILFSALHGTTHNWTNTFLSQAGFKVINSINQNDYDAQFTTLTSINPEDNVAFTQLQAQIPNSEVVNGSLMILNDCDGDRVRVAVFDQKQWHFLHGNELATLIGYFLLAELNRQGIVYRTWVSTPLIDWICQTYQQPVITTETGPINLATAYFKQPHRFLFAFEESLGYLPSLAINTYKDGILTAQLVAEIANYLHSHYQLTLQTYLNQIYQKYQFFAYGQSRYQLATTIRITTLWEQFRTWTKLGTFTIKRWYCQPNCKVLRIIGVELAGNDRVLLRFSATEPIFKVYFISVDRTKMRANQKLLKMQQQFQKQFAKINPKLK